MIQGEEAKMQVTVFNYKSDMQRVRHDLDLQNQPEPMLQN